MTQPSKSRPVARRVAWASGLVVNLAASTLAWIYIYDQFHNAASSFVGNLLGWEALAIWVIAEALVGAAIIGWHDRSAAAVAHQPAVATQTGMRSAANSRAPAATRRPAVAHRHRRAIHLPR